MALSFWLRLSLLSGIGPAKAAHLLDAFNGDIYSVFRASPNQLQSAGLTAAQAQNLLQDEQTEIINKTLSWADASDQHHLLTLDSPQYPIALKQATRPPIVLYVKGNLALLDGPQLAMVGSRNASEQGKETAFQFAKYLSTSGITVTSGLALGIDSASHQGALVGCASTIAVMATGIDRLYPAKNKGLAESILDNGGTIITEFPLGSSPNAHHFPQRNRIIAGLALGTLVVESSVKSGSLITARLTQEMNREVFAIPGSIHNPMAKGCHQLIKQGAKLVETAHDIVEEIAPSLNNALNIIDTQAVKAEENEIHADSPVEAPSQSLEGVDADHAQLLDKMGYDPVTIDQLVEKTVFSASEVASMLLIMELEGQVLSEAGGRYQRCQ